MSKLSISKLVKKSSILYSIAKICLYLYDTLIPVKGRDNCIIMHNLGGVKKSVIGDNNRIEICKGTVSKGLKIRIRGNNNTLFIGENVYIGPNCSFWLEGNNNKISIGAGTTFTTRCHLNAQEHDTCIAIGDDCMFSNSIIVRTSDSHPIYIGGNRVNFAKSVTIGNHVWIAPSSTIMKGVSIGNNTIIGSHSLVTKDIPSNTLAVGMPAKVVKENVHWTRENIIK